MKYRLIHKTTYQYGEYVSICHSLACLKPRDLPHQKCLEFKLSVEPVHSEMIFRKDFYDNMLTYFSIQMPHNHLIVTAQSLVEVQSNPLQLSFQAHTTYRQAVEALQNELLLRNEMLQFILPSDFVAWTEDIKNFAYDSFPQDQPLYACIKQLCEKIYREFKFQANHTTINTPVATVLKEKKGVCQDFSHLAIACFRSMGLAARYVSGYIETLPPPGKRKLQGSDASHAWISVFIPGLGWYDYDPTNNMVPAERHITVAWGRDYGDVTPLKGIVFSSKIQTLKVQVDMVPLH